jgi:hypothetical protein
MMATTENYRFPIDKLREPTKGQFHDKDTAAKNHNTSYTHLQWMVSPLVFEGSPKIPVVLVACGCFSPVTFLHLRLFGTDSHESVRYLVVVVYSRIRFV